MSMNQDTYCTGCKQNDVQGKAEVYWDQCLGRYEVVEGPDIWFCNTCQSDAHGVVWLFDWEWETWSKESA